MNCNQIKQLLSTYLDNEVNDDEKADIEAHVSQCTDCRQELDAISAVQSDFRLELNSRAENTNASNYTLQTLKTHLAKTQRSRRLPILHSIKARVARWWRGLRMRPSWQQACILVPMAAVLAGSGAAIGYTIDNMLSQKEFLSSFDIYMMDADGSNVVQLTDDDLWNGSFSFAADGERILFASGSGPRPYGDHDIYIMDVDGSNVVRLTENDYDDLIPMFSPDNSKIAFTSWRDTPLVYHNPEDIPDTPDGMLDSIQLSIDIKKSGKGDIYIMAPDGTNVTRVTETPNAQEYFFVWSPDGSKFAFQSTQYIYEENKTTRKRAIHVINADGTSQVDILESGRITRVVDSGDGDHQEVIREQDSVYTLPFSFVAWFPDSTQLLFEAVHIDDGHGLYLANADGSEITDITPTDISGYAARPKWSPDGSKISFLAPTSIWDGQDSEAAFYALNSEATIYTMNIDGSSLTELADVTYGESNYWWSKDGTKITYSAEPEFADFFDGHEIFTINVDGTGNTRLTENDYPDYWPKWSPDGSKILFYKAAKRYNPVTEETES